MSKVNEFKKRWPNFHPKEVLSPFGYEAFTKGQLLVNPGSLDKLQELRSRVGRILCNVGGSRYRGYRSSEENEKVGGVQFSLHVVGRAFDITPLDTEIEEVIRVAREVGFGYCYKHKGKNSIHVGDSLWEPK